MEEVGLFASSPSSQLEEKHQQHVSPHLLQYLQYLPKKFVLCVTSPSESVWVTAAVYMGSVKFCGGVPITRSVGMSISEEFSSVCAPATLWGILPFLDFI